MLFILLPGPYFSTKNCRMGINLHFGGHALPHMPLVSTEKRTPCWAAKRSTKRSGDCFFTVLACSTLSGPFLAQRRNLGQTGRIGPAWQIPNQPISRFARFNCGCSTRSDLLPGQCRASFRPSEFPLRVMGQFRNKVN